MSQEDRKFRILWSDRRMDVARLARIYDISPTEIVEWGQRLGLNGHLKQQKQCAQCWYYAYCNQREIKLYADLLPCEGGEPVPFIANEPSYYHSPTGEMKLHND